MMYIFKRVNGVSQEIHWWIGMPKPANLDSILADNVVMVQADGDELASIIANMPGIPRALGDHPVQRWYGDHAKFIAGNL